MTVTFRAVDFGMNASRPDCSWHGNLHAGDEWLAHPDSNSDQGASPTHHIHKSCLRKRIAIQLGNGEEDPDCPGCNWPINNPKSHLSLVQRVWYTCLPKAYLRLPVFIGALPGMAAGFATLKYLEPRPDASGSRAMLSAAFSASGYALMTILWLAGRLGGRYSSRLRRPFDEHCPPGCRPFQTSRETVCALTGGLVGAVAGSDILSRWRPLLSGGQTIGEIAEHQYFAVMTLGAISALAISIGTTFALKKMWDRCSTSRRPLGRDLTALTRRTRREIELSNLPADKVRERFQDGPSGAHRTDSRSQASSSSGRISPRPGQERFLEDAEEVNDNDRFNTRNRMHLPQPPPKRLEVAKLSAEEIRDRFGNGFEREHKGSVPDADGSEEHEFASPVSPHIASSPRLQSGSRPQGAARELGLAKKFTRQQIQALLAQGDRSLAQDDENSDADSMRTNHPSFSARAVTPSFTPSSSAMPTPHRSPPRSPRSSARVNVRDVDWGLPARSSRPFQRDSLQPGEEEKILEVVEPGGAD